MTSVPAGRPEEGPSRSEEDRRLLIRYHRHGDQAAREQLVQRLLPLARRMARCVDPNSTGPVIELGPGTGPVTEALVQRGIDPKRLILVEFDPDFCRLLRTRYPEATVVQGDAYRLRRLLGTIVREPAAAVVSGLPLMTKPPRTRLRLISDAMALLKPGAPFVQFTYAMSSPIPKDLGAIKGEPSELIWLNIPPARVWTYRGV